LNILDFAGIVIEFFKGAGIWITLLGYVIARIIAFKRNIINKLQKEMGKGKLMTALVILNVILDSVDVDRVYDLLLEFKDKQALESDIKNMASDLYEILKTSIPLETSKEIMDKYREEQGEKIILLKNRKRWNTIRNDPKVDKALASILNIIYEKMKIRRIVANEKGKTRNVKDIVKSKWRNIPINKVKRKALEVYFEKKKNDEEKIRLDDIKEKLHRIYKKE
jgi:hypothetical protein